MAERMTDLWQVCIILCFNPHHTGEWLKVWSRLLTCRPFTGFNPHHTGEWLKALEIPLPPQMHVEFQSSSYWRMAESLCIEVRCFTIALFQSSSYWRMAERISFAVIRKYCECFNPHHTGEWLKGVQSLIRYAKVFNKFRTIIIITIKFLAELLIIL